MNGYPKAIVWDLDGTLIDSAPDIAHALNALLDEHGHGALGEADVRAMIGNGAARLIARGFAAAGDPVPDSQLHELLARFMRIYSACATNKTRLYTDARSVLEHFAKMKVQQGICTNKPEMISRQILSDLSIAEHFSVVVGGDTTTAKKPDPLPLRTCLEGLGVSQQHSLMIGDSAVDVATARAMNMPVGIVSFGYARQAVEELGADFLIDTLAALPGFVAENFNHAAVTRYR